jgi:superfamily I DNA/RNA helicase
MAQIFDGLNEAQKQAVMTTDGPLLVVAGPGTGKTLTIVRRIARLIQQGVKPESILAVTFTNRAAREMRERTHALLGSNAERIFIGTFHLLGLRIIRESRGGEFLLYNREDQIEILKSLKKGSAKKAQRAAEDISRIKNFLEVPKAETKRLYESYQEALKKKNAFDFDDLIRIPIDLLENGEFVSAYRDRFKHIIGDEYQDINPAQYRLLKLLAGSTGNVCAVGDSDQAIYNFRGADIGNFLSFEKDFPGAARITLTENYRSSGIILKAADNLIKTNQKRIEKELVPTREQGAPVSVIGLPDERAEGELIVNEIEARMGGTSRYHHYRHAPAQGDAARSCRFSDFAVIYRTNAQARTLEEAFNASGIPYQVIGGRRSAQRAAAEETIAYLASFIRETGDAPPVAGAGPEETLLSPADFFDPRADAVALMTMHMAKGLEFKVVFIAGVEEGLVPYTMNKDEVDIEEERRLFYVGMTRAKDEIFLLHARNRFLYGQRLSPLPSPFLGEIPKELIQSNVVPDRIKKERPEEKQLGLF